MKKENKKNRKSIENKKIENKKVENKEIENTQEKWRPKTYISYNARIFIYSILFVLFFGIGLFLTQFSFQYSNATEIDYSESQKIDYKVYLKKNDFYDEEYLEKDRLYVASLIDNISIDFDYRFNIDKLSNIGYDYKVVGDLIITDNSGANKFFEKEYTLVGTQHSDMKNEKTHDIVQNVIVDYDYYNSLANDFKTKLGLDTISYLKVKLIVTKISDKETININDSIEETIKIPLSEKAVQIDFDSEDTNYFKKAIVDEKIDFNSKIFIIQVICLIVSLALIYRLLRLLIIPKKKNVYDNYINKILREYDRFIVETTTGVDESKNQIIYINQFEELLDVRDNLKLPIMYYNIVKHQKCYFYIKNDNDIYLYKVKAVDMEVANDGKKEQTK